MAEIIPKSRNEVDTNPATTKQATRTVNTRLEPRPGKSNANASSYASHTQASKARQTDKVELAPSRPPIPTTTSNSDLTDPLAPSNSLLPPSVELNNRSRTSSLRSRGRERKETLSALLSFDAQATNSNKSDLDAYAPSSGGRRKSQVSLSSRGALRSEATASLDLKIAELEQEIKHDEHRYDIHQDMTGGFYGNVVEQAASDSGGIDVPRDGIEACEPGVQLDPNKDGKTCYHDTKRQDHSDSQLDVDSPDFSDQSATELIGKLKSRIGKLQLRIRELEQDLVEQEDSTAEALDGQELAVEREEAAIKKANILEGEIAELDKDLRAKTKDVLEAEEDLKIYNNRLTRLRKDVEYLTEAVKNTSHNSVSGAPDTKKLKDLRWHNNTSPHARGLHQNLLQLTEQMENRIQMSSAQCMHVHYILADKEKELAKAKRDLQAATRELEKPTVLIPNHALEQERDEWKQLYGTERKKREQAERRLEDFKETANSMYRPRLEQQNRELQIDLNVARDKNIRLQERAQALKTRAQRWEGEYKIIKSRSELESQGFGIALGQKEDDLLLCIKEYRDKMKDPALLEVGKLHEKLSALERDQEVTNKAFDRVKMAKSRIEETEIPRLLDNIAKYKEENKMLKDAWAKSGGFQGFGRASGPLTWAKDKSAASNKATSKSAGMNLVYVPTGYYGTHVPRCLHPEETAKRQAVLKLLREEQEKRRAHGDGLDVIVEQFRK